MSITGVTGMKVLGVQGLAGWLTRRSGRATRGVPEISKWPARRKSTLVRMVNWLVGCFVLVASLLVQAVPGDTTLISAHAQGLEDFNSNGAVNNTRSSFSADGRYVSFASSASNLVTGDTNGQTDIFVHDRNTGIATRVSVGVGGVQGNQHSAEPVLSADGRYVSFQSSASNLAAGDTNNRDDIFVHDRTTGTTMRVSVGADGEQGNNESFYSALSADGRYVSFRSSASNLVTGDTNGQTDIFVHDRDTGITTRVSLGAGGVQGNGGSSSSALSADGRYVSFASSASNLVTGDTNGQTDIFVHDRDTGTTTRVSVDSAGVQGNNASFTAALSADGRYVAFFSIASNLVVGDTNNRYDIFVHDRQTSTTTRVSVDSAGEQGNNDSFASALSADGRYVSFASLANNLVAGDTNSVGDVFVHDRDTGTTTRVSVGAGGAQGNNSSILPALSADGRYVSFASLANNLGAGDTNGFDDVFVHDRDTGLTTRVSVGAGGGQGNNHSREPDLSADGRYVSFASLANNLVAGDTNDQQDIFVHDRDTELTTRVSVGAGGVQANGFSSLPALNADGRYVSFGSGASNLVPGDTNGQQDIFVHDRDTGTTTRVSVGAGGVQGNNLSQEPVLSADGRYVSFYSNASNLVAGDTNVSHDVFVHDRDTGLTTRVSVGAGGVQGNGVSASSTLSADGRYVSFASLANNLVAGDTNSVGDVFVHDRDTGTTTRVSVGAGGAQGNNSSTLPALSADGRYVSFASLANNLVAGDTNATYDVFVHDRDTGLTTRVSVDASGVQGNNSSTLNALSADGRYVLFTSFASNLVAGDTNGQQDIFVHDRDTGLTTRVSVGTDGVQGSGVSFSPALSADGQFVAFSSESSFDSNDRLSFDIYVHERVPPNTTPTATGQSLSTSEDTSLAFTLSGTDPESDPLAFAVVDNPTNGMLSGTAPDLTYTPNLHYNGSDSFTFTVNDGTETSVPATVSITVTPVNDPPTAGSQSVSTNENTPVGITLTGADLENDPLLYGVITGPANGTLSGAAPNLTYTPNANFDGTDSFTFGVNDGAASSGPATVSITVNNVNNPPSATAQQVSTATDTPLDITLTGTDADSDPLSFVVATSPTSGALSGTAPNLTYTPAAGFRGDDSFTFTVNDGTDTSSAATVAITVNNAVPMADAQSVSTPENTPLGITLTGSDANNDTLTYAVATQPGNGTLSGTAPDLTYTPNTDFDGEDSFTFTVSDGVVTSPAATVSITVTNVNQVPMATAQSLSVHANNPLSITLTGVDGDNDPLTFNVVLSTSNGPLTGTAPNLTYTPDLNFVGSTALTFTVSDGIETSAPATIQIDVTNTDPVAPGQNLTGTEDTPLAFVLDATDADGDDLSFNIVQTTTRGVLSGTPPNLTYTPGPDYNGGDGFTYTVNDGIVTTGETGVQFELAPVNDAPTADAQSVNTDENTAVAITLAGSDVDGDSLTFNVASNPANGTLSGTAPDLTYTPNSDFDGEDSFTFTASDGTETSAAATVSITVSNVNVAPEATGQSVSTDANTALPVTLGGTDADNDPLTFAVATNPTNGTLSGTAPNLTYTPNTGFSGSDSFTFTVNDGTDTSVPATVSITIENGLPTATAQSVSTNENTAFGVTLTGSDPNGDTLTFAVVTGPSNGTLTGTAPNVTYTPNVNFDGADSFTFTVNDGSATSAPATVSITVTNVNQAPSATGQVVSTHAGTPLAITLSGSDPDSDPLTFAVSSGPGSGSLTGTSPNLTYTPIAGFAGADSFSFTASDGTDTSTPATVSISVTNTAPTATPQTLDTATNTALLITLAGTDADSDVLTFSVASDPASGSLTGTAPALTYTPNLGFSGADSFSFTVNDGLTSSAPATVAITVSNGAPTATNGTTTTAEDTAVAITLTGSDPNSDPNSDPLTFTVTVPPTRGTLTGTAPNLTYSPSPHLNGADSLSFTVNDGTTTSAAGTVSITVTPVNDVPIAFNESVETAMDTPVPVLLAGEDADGDLLTYTIVDSPSGGSLSGIAPTVTYIPGAGFEGSDSFTFTVNDGTVSSTAGTVSILVEGGGEPTKLPSSVLAVGMNPGPRGKILDEFVATGAQDLSTSWSANGSNAVSWFTIDLGAAYGVNELRLAPRRDRAFNLQVRVGDTLVGNQVVGALTATCTIPNIGVTVPATLVPCALPSGVMGRYITVQSDLTFLRMYGFEAWGGGGTANALPVASFTSAIQVNPLEVLFDGSDSTDADGTVETWRWHFGDGSPVETGAVVNHVYASSGAYLVTLTVTDNAGGESTNSQTVTVTSGTDPVRLPVTVVAAGQNNATRNNIVDVIAATNAQRLSTFWAASGGNAVSWYTVDLGTSKGVTALRLAPRRDNVFALRVTVGNTLAGGKVSGPQTATCTTPRLGVTAPTALVECTLPSGVFGRYVTVQSNLAFLRMYGFEVWGN